MPKSFVNVVALSLDGFNQVSLVGCDTHKNIVLNDDNTRICILRRGVEWMNECDRRISGRGDSKGDLCDAGAVLHRLSYHANWEPVFYMWVVSKPVDVETGHIFLT